MSLKLFKVDRPTHFKSAWFPRSYFVGAKPGGEGRANRRLRPRPLSRKKPARPFKTASPPQLPSEADLLLSFTRHCWRCLLSFACEPQAGRGARLSHCMMTDFGGGEAPHQGELSARGVRIAEGCVGLLDRGFDRYLDDPFDADQNPQGILNFGTSENKLCFDLLQERLSKPDMNYLEPHLLQYSDTQGIKSFREEIAKFLTEYANASVPLDPEHIIVMNGCCAVFATLSTVLCDPGDGYLIPTPYYGGINSKTWLYGGMQPVHVPLFSEVADEGSQPFQLTVDKLEAAYQGARGKFTEDLWASEKS
ncbi:1-aminocyclopropane-1-carboxylate synthase-like 1 [Crotalus adamanteus]|uniref:1-aminocyclopropane-1-carboxylate synthase-like 1 n=1 Tax=Crotalus adamanteus TaxID=8729 RepID=A0AAW1B3G5_CROAD